MKKRTFSKIVILLTFLFLTNYVNCFSINYHNIENATNEISNPKKDTINPVEVFEQVWQVFNTNYPYFEHKGVDWSALYKVYRAIITPKTTDEELFNILCRLLGNLNDGNVSLNNTKIEFNSNSGSVNGLKMEDFDWKLVRGKYLKGSFKSTPDSLIYYGWIDNDVAYLRLRKYPSSEVIDKYFDPIIQEFMKAKGVIIEVRGNSGGSASGVDAIANRFADKQRLFAKNYNRTGASKDFNNITYQYLLPKGPAQFTKTVVLLQNRFSAYVSDNFALAIRTLPHAVSIGEFTGGSSSNFYSERLINDWLIRLPWNYVTDQNGVCWEGIGVPPNLRIINTKEDIKAGNDKVLELAIDVIKTGGYARKEAQGSLNDLRISLVKIFLETSEKLGLKEAVSEFEKLQKKNPDGVYFSIHELMLAVRKFSVENKNDQALALLELGAKSFPNDLNTMFYLAKIYESKDQPEKAKEQYEKMVSKKACFPWDRNMLKQAENSLNNN
ncbi:MAG: S41 family peptidase [Tenuifilaceae bacterium]